MSALAWLAVIGLVLIAARLSHLLRAGLVRSLLIVGLVLLAIVLAAVTIRYWIVARRLLRAAARIEREARRAKKPTTGEI
jgi:hypothetical protein